MITEDEAIRIAEQDIRQNEPRIDLALYAHDAKLENDVWSISFRKRDQPAQMRGGGGPEYLIDAKSGVIRKKYYAR